MKHTVRTLAELGEDVVLAPERWLASAADTGDGIPLGDLVVERRERSLSSNAVVLDTTHARDGVFDIPSALRANPSAKSAKKRAVSGDLVVSRLRPYLRQIAFVHPKVSDAVQDRELALSSEFYVLTPRPKTGSLAFLLPFLLGDHAQAILAAAQEGGHHPRVPRSSLFALRVPPEVMQAKARRRASATVMETLDTLYDAIGRWERILIND